MKFIYFSGKIKQKRTGEDHCFMEFKLKSEKIGHGG